LLERPCEETEEDRSVSALWSEMLLLIRLEVGSYIGAAVFIERVRESEEKGRREVELVG
jgi:hypothetical protein